MANTDNAPASGRKGLLAMAAEGFRAYWPAMLAMQLCAGFSVIAYYAFEPVRNATAVLGGWKSSGGMLFASLATVFSGGVVPELLKWKLRPPGRPAPTAVELLHQFGYFAISGILVERFYALQGYWLGTGYEWWRVAVKILIDQAGYTLFVATPLVVAWFAWKEHGYHFGKTWRALTPALFKERVPPIFAPNVLFWAPSLVAVYSLPSDLQFILFIFLCAAWSILLVFIARKQTEGHRPAA